MPTGPRKHSTPPTTTLDWLDMADPPAVMNQLQQRSKIAALPDEILEMIMVHAAYFDFQACYGHPEMEPWLACSLVCRRWRRVILPHLFRRVKLAPHADHPDSTMAGEFLRFLSENRSIAQLIRKLDYDDLELDIDTLDSTLSRLPRLHSLCASSNQVRDASW
ncbi:hypothetical protein BC835DRAFT_217694 [Cytidiella melzeri]|nr:hypothetical protein BC835DRAFT_217694 [Cytidiella melzeri]